MKTIHQTISSIQYSIHFVWKYSKMYLIYSFLINILLGLAPFCSIWLTKELINEIVMINQNNHSLSTAIYLLLVQLLVILASFSLGLLSNINDQKLTDLAGYHFREIILSKVNRLPFLTFEHPDFYDRYQHIYNSEAQTVSMTKETLKFMSNLITVCSLVAYLFHIHFLLVIILFLCIIPLLFVEALFGNKRYKLSWFLTPYARKENYVSRLLSERNSLKEIKLFHLSEYLIKKWATLFQLNAKEKLRLMKKQSLWVFGADVIMSLTYVFSGLFVIFLIMGGKILVGEFVAILQAVQNIQSVFSECARSISRFYEGSLYIDEFKRFLQMKEEQVPPDAIQIQKIREVSIKQLSFRYPDNEEDTIQLIEKLDIKMGKKIAILGENGSGKTTLIKCLTGLYQTEPRMIYVNGIPIEQIDIKSYQDRIAVLFQDFLRYDFTAQHNIGFGRIEKMDQLDDLKEAANRVGIHDYISSLPKQYDSMLGRLFNEGKELSGGQWQKIALARAIFRDSDLIILDEPTSALDPKSEVEVIEQLFQLTQNKAVLFITHRLGAACLADYILVMKKGKIIEQGTHEELMKKNGEYSMMYRMQTKWYKNNGNFLIVH